MKSIKALLCTLAATFFLSASAAAAPTDTFTHTEGPNGFTTSILTREAYIATKQITAGTLGLDDTLDGIYDIYSPQDGLIYILCSEISRVIVLNQNYTLNKELVIVDESGNEVLFDGAQGIYVDTEGLIYIADTVNGRIILADKSGRMTGEWGLPQSDLIPDNFLYQPSKIVQDARGYTYILSLGSYYGTIMYSPENEFMGFYGANTVQATMLDTLSYLWDLLTSNDAKEAYSTKTLPYSSLDISFDVEGYMVTCSGSTSTWSNGVGQIRKIAPDGSNILFKRQPNSSSIFSDSFNFLEREVLSRNGRARTQNIVSIDVDTMGYIYALDKTYGLIYIYDRECNLINAFGGGIGQGVQLGTFQAPEALCLHGDAILVVDSETAAVTVFEQTEYGALLKEAQDLYIQGEYTQAKSLWETVLSMDHGNQLAYRGLAMASYLEKDYHTAMTYAQSGYDYSTYDLAYQNVLKDFIANHFLWIFPLCLCVLGAAVAVIIVANKRKLVLIKNARLNTMTSVWLHPFRAFNNVKEKKLGSVAYATVLTVLFYLAMMLNNIGTGFLFATYTAQNYNTFYTVAQTIGLVLLWSIANWLICSLFGGNGRLEEVFTVSAYALQPLIVYTFLRVVLSHFLSLSGMEVLDGLYMVLLIYTVYLIAVGHMAIHEYDFKKFILTSLVTLFCMVLVVFILFMIIILLQQFWNFIYSVFMEIVYR